MKRREGIDVPFDHCFARDCCRAASLRLGLFDSRKLDARAIVMGETPQAGSAAVEAVGTTLGIDMADWWPIALSFTWSATGRILVATVAEVAGKIVAPANANKMGVTLRCIIANHLDGTGGRSKVERSVPRWLAFPSSRYAS